MSPLDAPLSIDTGGIFQTLSNVTQKSLIEPKTDQGTNPLKPNNIPTVHVNDELVGVDGPTVPPQGLLLAIVNPREEVLNDILDLTDLLELCISLTSVRSFFCLYSL